MRTLDIPALPIGPETAPAAAAPDVALRREMAAEHPAAPEPARRPTPALDLPQLLAAIAAEPTAPAMPARPAARPYAARPGAERATRPAEPPPAAPAAGPRITIGSIQLRVMPPPPAPAPAPRPAAPERPERFAPHRHYLGSG
ncbi:MAG: hypothetical protein U1E53_31360 [Dongiaceae bacterium]